MPVDLKKFQRIFLIHQKLRSNQRFSWEELADACQRKLDTKFSVSKRTIEYDISTLKNEFNAPIKQKKGLYYYEEPYSIFEVFDDKEYGSINELLALLRQQKAKEFMGMEEVLLQLEQKVGTWGGEQSQIVFFEQNTLKGIEYLEKLYRHIKENRTLELEYEPFGKPSYNRIIKPIFLKQYNNRWFIFAWEKDRGFIQNIAIDRINDIKFSSEEMKTIEKLNVSTYFNEVVGVTVNNNNPIEKIKFKVKKKRAFYVETKPIHDSQTKVFEDDFTITFEIKVKINQELEAKLMEYGNDILILEPKSFQETIKQKFKDILDEYDQLVL